MDSFELNEEIGRSWFASFVKQLKTKTEWIPSLGRYNFIDGFVIQKDKKYVVEIKTRSKKFLNCHNHLIELNKYMNMTKVKVDSNCKNGFYVNFFGEDTLYIYDLKDINTNNCKLVERLAQTSTVCREYKRKLFLEIPTRYAIKFKKINNRWTRIN